jgi:hypothetical protein
MVQIPEGMARRLEGTFAKIVNRPSIFSFIKDEAFSHLIWFLVPQ